MRRAEAHGVPTPPLQNVMLGLHTVPRQLALDRMYAQRTRKRGINEPSPIPKGTERCRVALNPRRGFEVKQLTPGFARDARIRLECALAFRRQKSDVQL